MRLQFLGATGTVTGSKYLLRAAGKCVLVDCGLFQGYKQLRLRNWAPLPVAPATLDAVVLTHAHLDHSGYIPLLVRNGFRGRILCSEATRDLCAILLPDSGRLLEEEAAYANRHGYSKHAPALPLYTAEEARASLQYFSPVPFDARVAVAAGVHVRFRHAGHILGAATATLDDGRVSVAFSGDLGRPADPLMRPPEPIGRADYLLVESTYGNRIHDLSDPLAALGTAIQQTVARGGVVVIPSFAVGRAQELLYYMHLLKRSGTISPLLPVYLDSPMAADTTALYRKHRDDHKLGADECRAMCSAARIANSVDDSKAIDQQHMPMVIIAASGMATGGRVLHHLKAFASDPRNTILFAGYQAGGTRGASMVAGATTIKLLGEQVPVRARVMQMANLSAHADAAEILGWLRGFTAPPRHTFIVHGEPDAADALRRRIQDTLHWRCSVPDYLESVELS